MSTARKCKTKYLAKSAFVYLLVSAGLILSAKVLLAQQSTRSITIVPPGSEFRVDPGAKSEGMLKVVNNSDTPLTFKAQVKDFIVEDTVGTPRILPDNTLSQKYSASSWIAVSPDSFTILPGQTQQINYYLQVPADARPGGHYAAVLYQPQETIGVQGTGAGVQTHLGTLFYVTVNGDMVENATVKKFAAEHIFNEYGPVKINTQIANYSDTHIRPTGIIVVKNLLGQTILSQALPEHNIFPEANRDFVNEVGDKFMFGPYTAELRANYGTNNSLTLFASATFFVLPWKIAGIVVLAIIALVLLAIFLRRKKKRQQTPPPANPAPQPAVQQ